MKRIMVLLFCLALLIACVPTPEEDFVANKAEGRLEGLIEEDAVEAYAPSSESRSLKSRLGAPETLQEELTGKDMDILAETLRLMAGEYASGTTTLSDILQTEREQLNYAFSHAEAQAQYNMIVAEFEKLASVQMGNEKGGMIHGNKE